MVSKTSTKRISLVLALFMVLGMLVPASALAVATDIDGHWGAPVIGEWMDAGLAGGYADGTFRPNNPVTRAEFMAFTNRAFGFSAEAAIDFSDVSADSWYAGVVKVAVGAGYVSGYPDGTMRPNSPITRQEASVILSQVTYLSENAAEAAGFSDQAQIPAWSRGFVGAVADAGLMVGYPDASFRPTNNITRAEAVSALNNAMDFLTVYDAAGTYGPETGRQTLEGNVVIRVEDVVLQNITVKGDLILAEGIGDGDATLNNVIVEGDTFIRGGGANSIIINGGSFRNIFVERVGGSVRVVATDATGANVVLAKQAASDDDTVILEGTFDSVTISAPNVRLALQGETTVRTLTVESTATSATVSTTSTVTVEKATIETKTTVTGEGTIKEAGGTAASESTFEKEPEKITTPPADDKDDDDTPATGGGGGGGVSPTLGYRDVEIELNGELVTLGEFNRTDLKSTDRVGKVTFTMSQPNTTMFITRYFGGNEVEFHDNFDEKFLTTSAELSFAQLVGADEKQRPNVSIGALRQAFGDSVTISGRLEHNDFATRNVSIELVFTGDSVVIESFTTDWADVKVVPGGIEATLLEGKGNIALAKIEIVSFLTGTIGVMPSGIRFGSEGDFTVTKVSNAQAVKDLIVDKTTAESWGEVTLSHLVDKDIQFTRTGSTQPYQLWIK